MRVKDLPPAMHTIPVLIGIALSVAGRYLLPHINISWKLGPIIGLPVGILIGLGLLALIAAATKDKKA